MLILIFKYKNYVDNRFTELILHEIALWCCKMGILEVCRKTLICKTELANSHVPHHRISQFDDFTSW
jgi:hypothetical protein